MTNIAHTGAHQGQTATNSTRRAFIWRNIVSIVAIPFLLSAGVACAPTEPAGSPSPEDKKISSATLSVLEGGQRGDECPPCESLFANLEKSMQRVSVQLCGEPKSGTTFMYEWAVNALMVSCSYLERLYGRGTCQVLWKRGLSKERPVPISELGALSKINTVMFVFDPRRTHQANSIASPGSAAACSCEEVKSVSITVSSLYKHGLPVSKRCSWQHLDDITPEGKGCTTVGGHAVQNYTDTERCLHENPCTVTDKRHQMLILRDPRAVVVSSFFRLVLHPKSVGHTLPGESLDNYALRMLPTVCRFVHLRYMLLQEQVPDRTVEFLYDESLADPLDWNQRWLSFVGLTLPESVVQKVAGTAQRREFGFTASKGVSEHAGGKDATPDRRWTDEVSPEMVGQMYEICRLWLPPVLLDKFGIGAPP